MGTSEVKHSAERSSLVVTTGGLWRLVWGHGCWLTWATGSGCLRGCRRWWRRRKRAAAAVTGGIRYTLLHAARVLFGTAHSPCGPPSAGLGPDLVAAFARLPGWVSATGWATSYHRKPTATIDGYSHVMNRLDPTKAHAVPHSVALCDEVYAGRHERIDPFVGG